MRSNATSILFKYVYIFSKEKVLRKCTPASRAHQIEQLTKICGVYAPIPLNIVCSNKLSIICI